MPEEGAHLLVFEPDGQTSAYVLEKRETLLGRSDTCDLQLVDLSVSREHARISRRKGSWIIRDLRSVNGTYVNGKSVAEQTLGPGDEIVLGTYQLRFICPAKPDEPSGPVAADRGVELSTRIVVLDDTVPPDLAKIARQKSVSLATVSGENPLDRIVGCSAHIEEVKALIRRAARSEAPVLVRGETGTGKELVAQAIAKLSANRRPYAVAVNLAAVDSRLAAAELFGHERGAFTGADRERQGMIELADGATLFLDEVGNAPSEVQSMLLRVLETGEVRPVGGRKFKPVNVRLLAATNRDLQGMMEHGQFSDALYYRLSQFEIQLRPLRERKEDILPLARHFLATHARSRGMPVPGLSTEAATILCSYSWPGNVRELKGCIEYAVTALEGDEIAPSCLPPRVRGEEQVAGQSAIEGTFGAARRALIVDALRQTGGNQSQAGKILGVSRQAIHQMIKRFGVEETEWQ